MPVFSGVAECTTGAGVPVRRAMPSGPGSWGLMVLPAMVYKSDPRETMTHFRTVAAASDLPIMVYNNPVSYHVDITPEMFAELADEPKFVAIKESSENVRRITDLEERLRRALHALLRRGRPGAGKPAPRRSRLGLGPGERVSRPRTACSGTWPRTAAGTRPSRSTAGTRRFCTLELGGKVPIQPGKGYSLTMPRPSICPSIPVIFPETRVVVTPFQSGYRIGSTMEFSGYDTTIDPGRLQLLRDGAAPYLREPECEPIEERWYGWRPMTWDSLPIIDRSPAMDNVVIAAGHNIARPVDGPSHRQARCRIARRRRALSGSPAVPDQPVLNRKSPSESSHSGLSSHGSRDSDCGSNRMIHSEGHDGTTVSDQPHDCTSDPISRLGSTPCSRRVASLIEPSRLARRRPSGVTARGTWPNRGGVQPRAW